MLEQIAPKHDQHPQKIAACLRDVTHGNAQFDDAKTSS